jgi:hypothetical protein
MEGSMLKALHALASVLVAAIAVAALYAATPQNDLRLAQDVTITAS